MSKVAEVMAREVMRASRKASPSEASRIIETALIEAEGRGLERAAALMNRKGAAEEESQGLTREVQNYYRMRNAIRALPATEQA